MKRIVIDYMSNQYRTALIEDGQLLELIIENKDKKLAVGNIYIGKIKKILPSKFVFIDLGDEKNAFLYLNDKKDDFFYSFNELKGEKELTIKQGQEILVQVEKDAVDEKGAVVTGRLSFAGKYVVLLINDTGIGISKKIENTTKREELKNISKEMLPEGFGLIMRTNCENVSTDEIKEEIRKLLEKSRIVLEKGNYTKAPLLIYEAENETEKIIRDFSVNYSEDEVIVNSKQIYEEIKNYTNAKYYDNKIPIFDYYSIESQIEKALNNKIWLKSGGFIVIDETEALAVIDVNTGKHTGANHRKTVFKTNSEAVIEILKQVRLRNISGMIIIDFIDMQFEEDRAAIKQLLYEHKKKDRIPITIVGMTELSLMQLTRKKSRLPLSKVLLCDCPSCKGLGKIENELYISDKIRNRICSIFSQTIYNKVIISSNKRVIDAFRGNNDEYKEIEQLYGKEIILNIIPTQKLDYFEIEKKP